MLYFVEKRYRVIAHDRRRHGPSSQVSDGHDMDHRFRHGMCTTDAGAANAYLLAFIKR